MDGDKKLWLEDYSGVVDCLQVVLIGGEIIRTDELRKGWYRYVIKSFEVSLYAPNLHINVYQEFIPSQTDVHVHIHRYTNTHPGHHASILQISITSKA